MVGLPLTLTFGRPVLLSMTGLPSLPFTGSHLKWVASSTSTGEYGLPVNEISLHIIYWKSFSVFPV